MREGANAVPQAELEATMLALAAARGPDKTICPSEVARAVAGDHPDAWGPLMGPVRRAAVRLMKEGRVVITRKGKAVDPDDFRGVYRIRVARPEERSSRPEQSGEPGPRNTSP